MKLNTRALALSLAFGIVASANAQDIAYKMVFASANALNGAAAGDELPAITKIGPVGSSIQVSLVATNVTASDKSYGAFGMMITFDQDLKNAGNYTDKAAFDAAADDKKLDLTLPNAVGDSISGFPVTWLNRNYSGSFGAGTTQRGIGVWAAGNFGAGTNLPIAAGDTYGDAANENGLKIFGAGGSPTSRITYFGTLAGTGANKAPKGYALQAVPEPATIAAMAAGLVALARRRRK